jgi:hypothetical protein
MIWMKRVILTIVVQMRATSLIVTSMQNQEMMTYLLGILTNLSMITMRGNVVMN